MTVLTIRSAKRFAVRDEVVVDAHDCSGKSGLMIELSAEGCRISCLGDTGLSSEDEISVTTSCGTRMSGRVRWAHGGKAGVRFDTALHQMELGALLATANPLHPSPLATRYGT